MLITKKNIDYIKTVQKVKHFFEEFQQLRYVSGLTLKPQLSSDGCLEESVFPIRDDGRKKNVAVMLELPYEIAQFKRIKKRAVLALATEMGIVVRKNN
ncbi:transcriptional regulator [Listeria seeligeri]|uniref:transcriptional regulator n=1 Tax=Listeria seeligeri TaxID=1640 RepID=UPI0018891834|nr:transcriptional regulator [Listeria seeligeri]MBF2475926.1 transcriptional regulator [Listeria seeligeri]